MIPLLCVVGHVLGLGQSFEARRYVFLKPSPGEVRGWWDRLIIPSQTERNCNPKHHRGGVCVCVGVAAENHHSVTQLRFIFFRFVWEIIELPHIKVLGFFQKHHTIQSSQLQMNPPAMTWFIIKGYCSSFYLSAMPRGSFQPSQDLPS